LIQADEPGLAPGFFAVQNDPAIVFSNPESVVFDE